MKKTEAEKLVNETFNQAYNEDRFRRFINELFHEYEKPEDKTYAGQYIWDAFKEGIVSYKRLCKFKDPEGMEVDVLAVKVPSRRTLENARTMQRNFIARYLNGSRGGKLKDAALVAFYSDDCDDWRFSLVRMDYVLDEEKQKIRKELTPARRFSFLVGKNEMTHTARRQLMPVLQSETETTLSELETAFNIETVTKEFFEKYKALYVSLKDALVQHLKEDKRTDAEFEGKSIKVEDFAKRLLGQIVFLYFLQKKGWLGVAKGQPWGLGPKDFLQRLYRKELVAYDNFFNDVLEHLFYDALATERHTQDHFFPALNCKIPFLNGGLFEPFKGYAWDDTDILLDNAIFKEIFDVFDLYNFTVREDEPLDKEVAVDPEMLGKVFENLIPENERKGSGTYYTPREIVHYMCQESLINYLDAKLNIESRPVVEKGQQSLIPDMSKTDLLTNYEDVYAPVVPREDIAEFIYHGDIAQEHDATAELKSQQPDYKGKYQHKVPESVRKNAQVIDDALASVKICDPAIGSGAFPVGVMNEIVRARGALNAYLGDEGRTPYDFKRHAIQESIYGVDIEPSAVDIAKLRLWLSLVVDEDDFGNIKPLPNLEYKIVSGNSLLGIEKTLFNSNEFAKLEESKNKFFDETRPSEKEKLKSEIAAIIKRLSGNEEVFDFDIYFSEVFRLRGGFDIVIANPPYVSYGLRGVGKMSKDDKDFLKKKFPNSAEYKISLYAIFMNICNDLCAKNGVHTLIVPDSFLLGLYFSKIRKHILKQNEIRSILFLTYNVFQATVGYPTVYCFQRQKLKKLNDVSARTAPSNAEVVRRDFKECVYSQSYFNQTKHNRFRLFFEEKIKDVVQKIERDKPELGKFYRGRTGVRSLIGQKAIVGKTQPAPTWKKGVASGGLVTKYHVKYDGDYINIDPALLNKGGWDKDIIENPKILIRQTGDTIIAALDNNHYYHLNNIHSFAPLNPQLDIAALLGILNSRLMEFFYKTTTLELGRAMAQTDIETLESLPIVVPSKAAQEELGKLVAQTMQIYEKNEGKKNEETILRQKKVDQLVYNLYGLTPEEIAIVEEAVK